MTQVDLASLRIEDSARTPRRPLGPRLLAGSVLLLLLATAATFLWPLLRPVREVPTAPIRAAGQTTIAAAGIAVAEAVGWVEPDPFPIVIKPLVSGRIETLDVLEGREIVAGETLIATMASAELQAAHERAVDDVAEREAAVAVALAKREKAKAHLAQHAQHRRAIADSEVSIAEKETKLVKARGAAAKLAATAAGEAAALTAQQSLTEAGSGHPIALARATAAAQAAEAASAAAAAEVTTIEHEITAERARLALNKELRAESVDLEWNLRIAEAEYAGAAQALNSARTEQSIASRELDQAQHVVSPVSGIVLELLSQPGETAGPGGAGIVTLYDPARLQARIDVPLDSVAPVRAGQRVELTSETTGSQVVHGVVQRIQQQTDLLKNTLQVKISLTDPPAIWRPETLCRARFLGSDNAAQQPGRLIA